MARPCFFNLLIHSLMGTWVMSTFLLLWIILINKTVQISVQISALPRIRIAVSHGNSLFNFLWLLILVTEFSIEAVPFFSPTSNAKGFQFSCLFVFPPNGYEMVSHCGFGLHFSTDYWYQVPFHVIVGHLYIFFEQMGIKVLYLKKKEKRKRHVYPNVHCSTVYNS